MFRRYEPTSSVHPYAAGKGFRGWNSDNALDPIVRSLKKEAMSSATPSKDLRYEIRWMRDGILAFCKRLVFKVQGSCYLEGISQVAICFRRMPTLTFTCGPPVCRSAYAFPQVLLSKGPCCHSPEKKWFKTTWSHDGMV